jgi:hypothetical protein
MEITPATPEQIAEFKAAAAARYAEHGVKPEHAQALFDNQLSKVAAELGVDTKDAMCSKSHGDKKKKKTKKADPAPQVDKIASVIAQGLGRKRKTK